MTGTEQTLQSSVVYLRLPTSNTTANGTSVTRGQIGCCVLHTNSVTRGQIGCCVLHTNSVTRGQIGCCVLHTNSVTRGQTGFCVLHTNSVTSCHGARLNVSFPVRRTARPFLCPLAQNSCVFDKVLSIRLLPNSWQSYKPFGSGYLGIDRRTDGRTKHTLSK